MFWMHNTSLVIRRSAAISADQATVRFFFLPKSIPSTSGTSDLEIYFRQSPLTMVSGGQAPEIPGHFQYGLVAYAREVVGKTEQYWCPIKHARKTLHNHPYYHGFADFGDAETYHAQLESLRKELSQMKVK
mgnify:CR=1 FL=1